MLPLPEIRSEDEAWAAEQRLREAEERFATALPGGARRRLGGEIIRLRAALTAYELRAEREERQGPQPRGRFERRPHEPVAGEGQLIAG